MGGLLLLKLVVVVVLSAVMVTVSSGFHVGHPFKVRGKVYCDTCRCGFETNITTYIQGAKVKVECMDREGLQVKYSMEGVTGVGGEYEMNIQGDRGDDICQSVLLSSPLNDCAKVDPGRATASIILTRSNGLSSNTRYVNNMGFLLDQALPACSTLLQDYYNTPY